VQLFANLLKATFINRPNRFVVHASLEGETVEVYLSNPGRLSELLFEGVTLLIQSTAQSKGRMDWRAVGILEEDHAICLHTHAANDFAAHLINQGNIPELAGWRVKKREHTVGNSRFDLLLEKDGVERLGEVKSCTLFSKSAAMFPDAPSKRAIKHVQELAELAPPDGPKPLVMFLVGKQGPTFFVPDWHTDLDFAQALLAAKDRLEILAVAVDTDTQLNLSSKTESLPIQWDLVEREAHDQGVYLYLMALEEKTEIEIGALGKRTFEAGYYIYVGSAAKNLNKRLARHQRLKKKAHWHIDYFRAHAKHHLALPIRTQDDIECDLAAGLSELADFQVPQFGCSDCSCESHFFGFHEDPLEEPRFFDFLFHHRIERYPIK